MTANQTNRTAWIIGATSGIGRALALGYAGKGYRVFASARRAGKLNELGLKSRNLKGKILPLALDITRPEQIENAIDTIKAETGRIDLVLISAGIYEEMTLKTLDPGVLKKVFEINTFGPAECLMALIPAMRGQGGGKIGVISSVAGYRGLPRSAAYGASKAAISHFCEALLPEVKKAAIDLKVISPGFIKTPMTRSNQFPMPFMISAEKAARRIIIGMESRRFEITFPKRFTWLMKLLRVLPYGVYNRLTNRLSRNL